MNDHCTNLDDYIADDLPAAEMVAFAAHLQLCDECRENVEQQRWIEGLLQSPLRLELEPVPGEIAESMRSSLARRERRPSKYLAMALASAAAILIAVGWVRLSRQADDGSERGAVLNGVAKLENDSTKDRPRAAFVSNPNAIAVPVNSRHSNVTVVRIYPTYQPRYATQTAAIKPAAATSSKFKIYSNGG